MCPFPEDDIVGLVGLLGPERVLFGSDWPHPEGLAEPLAFGDLLGGLGAEDRAAVMRGNDPGRCTCRPDGERVQEAEGSSREAGARLGAPAKGQAVRW